MQQRSATFVIKRAINFEFYFVLIAPNGQVIATSETYKSKQSAKDGINSVKRYAPSAMIVDQS